MEKKPKRPYRLWPEQTKATMRDLRARGYTLERIADVYDCHWQTVQRLLRNETRRPH